LRRTLAIAEGNPVALVATPLSATLIALSLAVLLLPILIRKLKAKA